MDHIKPTNLSPNKWNKSDTYWILSLYGTATGAGILFLPINAGLGGLLPVIIMGLLAFPITLLSHRNFARLILLGKKSSDSITDVTRQQFGKKAADIVTTLYVFVSFPALIIYGVALTNSAINVSDKLLGLGEPNRLLTAYVIALALMIVVNFKTELILKLMSYLVFPLIAFLIFFSLAMIPNWNLETLQTLSFSYISPDKEYNSLVKSLWMTLPVIIFAFFHAIVLSPLVCENKKLYGQAAEQKISKILVYAIGLMVATALLFVFSCVMVLGPDLLLKAKAENLSTLDYLAVYLDHPIIKYMAAGIAFVAVLTSFVGNYIGFRVGLEYFSKPFYKDPKGKVAKRINLGLNIFFFLVVWLGSYFNPSILKTIELIQGPIFSLLLFIFPLYAIYKLSALKKYRSKLADFFILAIGLLNLGVALSNFF